MLFTFLLAVFVLFSNGQQEDKVCVDEKPKNAPFSCYRYAELGLCKGLEESFCRKSCERCSCNETGALFCDLQGLIAFKNSFSKGQEYLKSWRGNNPCHEWDFIYCDPFTKRVVQIDFYLKDTIIQDSMSASLLPELSKLRYLHGISLWSVYLSGELPEEYSVLNKLKAFQLVENSGVNGTLPAQYKLWSQLESIIIQNNQISGTIPVEFSLWTSIKALTLQENQLYGKIPPNFSVWKQLLLIFLESNKFTGTLATEFSNWNQIVNFNVQYNILSGSLPEEYSTLSRMGNFSVAGNKLQGSLPQQYSTLSKMVEFFVSSNNLRGSLPTEYSLWYNCEQFAVYENVFLSGPLPVEYSKMKRMKKFRVYTNRFQGGLPKEYSTMIRLQDFNALNTLLVNHIPKEWSELKYAKISLP